MNATINTPHSDQDAVDLVEAASDAAPERVTPSAGSSTVEEEPKTAAAADGGILRGMITLVENEWPAGEQRQLFEELDRVLPMRSPDQSLAGVTDRNDLKARIDSRLLIAEARHLRAGGETEAKEEPRTGDSHTVGGREDGGSEGSCEPRRHHSRNRRLRRRRGRR